MKISTKTTGEATQLLCDDLSALASIKFARPQFNNYENNLHIAFTNGLLPLPRSSFAHAIGYEIHSAVASFLMRSQEVIRLGTIPIKLEGDPLTLRIAF